MYDHCCGLFKSFQYVCHFEYKGVESIFILFLTAFCSVSSIPCILKLGAVIIFSP